MLHFAIKSMQGRVVQVPYPAPRIMNALSSTSRAEPFLNSAARGDGRAKRKACLDTGHVFLCDPRAKPHSFENTAVSSFLFWVCPLARWGNDGTGTSASVHQGVQSYFQYYAKLSNQQNMLQDSVRTSTYHRAIARLSKEKTRVWF